MKKEDILIILAIFMLGAVLNANAYKVDLNEKKIEYYKNLDYNLWKDKQEKQIKKIQIKIDKMTEERFDKMKEMQLDYWENNL
ncbi:MAG: hypothetical protein PHO04_02250 [Candidatus Pacebacteria bacterium]|jgi:biopolymer transport protein ExbD|nr:hypothetical protein [Candidatus Paceibacterota bacterium]MDD2796583.1 hypothetical protein [Candidatus Paceibacterota bacterium]MDD3048099.1 hypothetical protein [Candidatus Paceibacterota bacterium]MDD3509761.1 hypothetical protein [Candidatus Paceibacterota bacterium]MDD3918706.1 hypothetical protein [Candidatus Paceibacterota bacterium]